MIWLMFTTVDDKVRRSVYSDIVGKINELHHIKKHSVITVKKYMTNNNTWVLINKQDMFFSSDW